MHSMFFIHDLQESPLARIRVLEMSGFAVTPFRGGAEALKRLTSEKPAVVLLDVLLEGPNGFAVCRSIRSLFAAAELPIVMCSGVYRSPAFRAEALAAGAQAYVASPVKLDDLVAEVGAVLRGRPTGARAA